MQEDEAAVIKKAAEKAETEYFRRFKKPEGWVYRRMENSVLGTGKKFLPFSLSSETCFTAAGGAANLWLGCVCLELDVNETSWFDVLDGQLEGFLERVLE